MPAISCHIIYNDTRFLEPAINSILAQDFTDLEIILVADGIPEFNKIADKRIRSFSSTGGMYPARNLAIKHTDSKYIAVMDGDDIAFPNRFSRQFEVMETSSYAWLGSNAEFIGEAGNSLGFSDVLQSHQELVDFAGYNSIHPSAILRRGQIDKYPEDCFVSGDVGLWVSLINRGFIVGNLPDVLIQKRNHSGQVSANLNGLQRKSTHHYLMQKEPYAREYLKLLDDLNAKRKAAR